MTTHRITLLAGWYQVDETRADDSVTPIGNFRTEADAREWLDIFLRMQRGRTEPGCMQLGRIPAGAANIKAGYSALPPAAPASIEAAASAPAEIEASVAATEPH